MSYQTNADDFANETRSLRYQLLVDWGRSLVTALNAPSAALFIFPSRTRYLLLAFREAKLMRAFATRLSAPLSLETKLMRGCWSSLLMIALAMSPDVNGLSMPVGMDAAALVARPIPDPAGDLRALAARPHMLGRHLYNSADGPGPVELDVLNPVFKDPKFADSGSGKSPQSLAAQHPTLQEETLQSSDILVDPAPVDFAASIERIPERIPTQAFAPIERLFDGVNSPLPSAESGGLYGLVQRALGYHPSVLQQRALTRAAKQNIKTARWQYFPTPSVSVQRAFVSADDLSYSGDDQSYTLGFDQPLWSGGRIKASIDAARASYTEATAGVDQSIQDLALRVSQGYGDWYAAWLQGKALDTSLDTHRRLLGQVLRRQEAGVSTGSDMLLARGRLQSTQAQRDATRASEDSALAVLSQLVGGQLGAQILSRSLPSQPNVYFDVPGLLAAAQRRDPQLRVARARVEVAKANLKSARAGLRPDIYLRFERQFGSFQYLDNGSDDRVIVGVRSQLGPGLSNLSGLRSGELEVQAAQAAIQVSKQQVAERVFADIALAESFVSRIEALYIALTTAQEVADSYNRQFLAGRKTWLDVMNGARDLQQAQLQLADAQAGYLVVISRLEIYARGPTGLGSLGGHLRVHRVRRMSRF